MKTDILALGNLTIDNINAVERITDSPSSSQVKSREDFFAGRCGNFSVFASAFGAKVRPVAYLGRDDNGLRYFDYLKRNGIDTSGIYRSESTSTAIIFKDESDTRIFFYSAIDGEYARFAAHAARAVDSGGFRALYCTSPMPQLNRTLLSSRKSEKVLKAFAPAHNIHQYSKHDLDLCLSNTDILFINEHEHGIVKKHYGSLKTAAKRFGIGTVVVTLGSDGSLVLYDGCISHVPSFRVSRVNNTVGTGDAFAAVFMSSILKAGKVIESARLASAAASFVVEGKGPQTNVPSVKEARSRMRSGKTIRIAPKIVDSIV